MKSNSNTVKWTKSLRWHRKGDMGALGTNSYWLLIWKIKKAIFYPGQENQKTLGKTLTDILILNKIK